MKELGTITETLEALKKSNTITLLKDKDTGKPVGVLVTLYDETKGMQGYNIPLEYIKSDNRMRYYITKAKNMPNILAIKMDVKGKEQYITPMEYNSKNYAQLVTDSKKCAKILEPFIASGYYCG